MSDSKSTPTYNNIYPAIPATAHDTVDTPPPYDGPSNAAGPASGAAPRTQSYGTYSKLPSQDNNPPIVILPAPIPVEHLKDTPAVVVCPHCNQCILTITEAHTGSATWLSALGLFILGATAWGCCLVPFCIPGLKDVIHVCNNCHQAIARYSRLNSRAVVFD
ncbi:hypothetical protein BC937DRAFT_94771 [Endogone sp. FLAS-F59071]|nr:hypothetical protein BC937DRAFT_94771 [Endogone sp. FLAS-F59071]|eukprot:RUS20623.1 hypothetical protein BC937DRAFT_94771 [Endogone sp. FLAS-F59071]